MAGSNAEGFRALRSQIRTVGFAQDQKDAYHSFVRHVESVVQENPSAIVDYKEHKHQVTIRRLRIERPTIQESNGVRRQVMPDECLRRRLSYKLWLYAELEYTVTNLETGKVMSSAVLPDMPWETVPCLKFSDYCNTRSPLIDPETLIEDLSEPGGYFIVQGQEKAMPMQEQARLNYPMVVNHDLEYRAFNPNRHRSTSTIRISLKPGYVTLPKTLARRTVSVELTVRMPFVSAQFDPVEIFRLAGVSTFDSMVEHIVTEADQQWFVDRVKDMLTVSSDVFDIPFLTIQKRMAADRMSNSSKDTRRPPLDPVEVAAALMCTEFYPNQGNSLDTAAEDAPKKAVQFGLSLRKLLLTFYEVVEPDDRDDYCHRRMAMSNNVMTLVFRRLYRNWRSGFENRIAKALDQGTVLKAVHIEDMVNGGGIGKDLEKMIRNGAVPDGRGGKSGGNGPNANAGGDSSITHMVSRIEPHAVLSLITRSSNPIGSKATKPRRQHFSSFGLFDPNQTPDGDTCGLVKHRCLSSGVRQGYLPDLIISIVVSTGLMVHHATPPVGLLLGSLWYVFVSGQVIGVCCDPDRLLNVLLSFRRCGDLAVDVSLYRDADGHLNVNADAGSMWWPMVRTDRLDRFAELVRDADMSQLWQRLICEGVVEHINKDEEQTRVRVAIDRIEYEANPENFNYVTVHPVTICSINGARMVLSEFNMAPRKTYGMNMLGQAQGVALTSAEHRFDTTSYTLWNAERPLVNASLIDETLRIGGHTNLQMVTIAMGSLGSQGAEDSFVVNQAFLDRGGMRHTTTRSRNVTFSTTDSKCEQAMLPPEVCHGKLHADYSKVDPEIAVVRPGTRITHNDVLVSRMSKKTTRGAERKAVQLQQRMAGQAGGSTSVIQDRSALFRHREDAVVDAVLMSKTLDGEPTVNVRTRSMKIPQTADKIACCLGDHRVMTTEGLVLIAEITLEHRVACYNMENDTIEYHHPTATMEYSLDKDACLIEFLGRRVVNQCVTQTHKMCIRNDNGTNRLIDAESAAYEYDQLNHIVSAGLGLQTHPSEKRPILTWAMRQRNEFAAFRVIGYVFCLPRWDLDDVIDDKDGYMFSSAVRTPEIIIQAIDALGWDTYLHCNGHYRFWIPHDFGSIIYQLIGAIPKDFRELPQGMSQAFLDGVACTQILAHPSSYRMIRPKAGASYELTVSYLELIAAVAINAGYCANINRHSDPPVVHLYPKKRTDPTLVAQGGVKVMKDVEGTKVYCITVPTGVFMVERDGCISMTGNSSRSGQKGVFGTVSQPENLPFIMKTGMVPDIHMNNHAIASRMTKGHPLEMQLGLVTTLTGVRFDGTPYAFEENVKGDTDPDAVYKHIAKILCANGFEENCRWVMADGVTGHRMESSVFVGVVGAQVLKHMVDEKWNARSRGPMVPGLNQPTMGRKEEGGLKDGEMERDAKLVHGAVSFLRERLMTSSDKVQVPVCVKCGNMAVGPKHDSARAAGIVRNSVYANQSFCHYCQESNTVVMVDMPCGFRTILGHQHALHVNMTYKFDEGFKQSVLHAS
jgi:DNA-directed RNA polymerase beta subunit